MANKFITWLEAVPADLKKFFTNPVVDSIITDGLNVAAIVDPALAPLLVGIAASVTKAEALAAAANVQSGSGAQKLALVTADAQAVFTAYETATGTTIETAQQTAIINSIVALLNQIPSSTTSTTSTPTVTSVKTQVSTGALL
jgi:hypothetical protein